jgi:RNA polymerase sigma factor (sigma-70 family)
MHDDPSAATLVARARDGDKQAWDAIIARYAPLIWAICRRYRLDRPNADDVGQSVWLRLADQFAVIRHPAALPGWIATTTRRECGRVLSAARKREVLGYAQDAAEIPDGRSRGGRGRGTHRGAQRRAARGVPPAATALPGADRHAHRGPAGPYAEISDKLGIKVGSIGHTRARCPERLRHYPAVAALISAGTDTAGGDVSGQPAVGR